jgi:hypothetical protein
VVGSKSLRKRGGIRIPRQSRICKSQKCRLSPEMLSSQKRPHTV